MKSFFIRHFFLILAFLSVTGCATYEKQISKQFKSWNKHTTSSKETSTIYLIGDAGNTSNNNNTLVQLKRKLNKENANSSILFLGDNIYPKGIPVKKGKQQKKAISKLESQLNILENFKGRSIFIPGNHDWYSGLKGLEKQENIVKKKLGKNSFLPKNGCPLEVVHLNDAVDIIIIDSQWYITNWDKHPEINDKCADIKTRKKFFVELEGLINKSQHKVTLIAMHHPVKSYGTHGGAASFQQHLFPLHKKVPLPGLGTLAHAVRKTSGLNPQDLQSFRYSELVDRVTTLAKEHKRLVFVSGHDHNLQYIFKNNIPQIVSGSGSKTSPTYLGKQKGFTYGKNGYAKLSIHQNDEVNVTFYSNDSAVFKTQIFKPQQKIIQKNHNPIAFKDSIEANIYPKNRTQKSKFYEFVWGKHYRKEYNTLVKAKTVSLDTLYGGLTVVKKGGGHQSKSLRLVNPQGKQYVMRALKKSAIRFLQTVAFQKDYIADHMDNTVTEDIVYDFYTSAHPYTPFIVSDLSDAVNVYHTNPKLFYVPKQASISNFTDEFGDALYMIEERPEKHHSDVISFGTPDDIISTDDLFAKLRKSKKNKLDEKSYVTARLFDMIIGDWDRHVDQWRWAVFKEEKHNVFRPIPRDRDQAFSNYDGALLTTLTTLVDPIKLMQTYKKNIRNLFKFNDEPYPIDISLLQEESTDLWRQQALFIKQHLTDEVIDKAFEKLPKNIQNESILNIKNVLKYRRDHAEAIALKYKTTLEKFAIVKGSDKDDFFEITSNSKTTTIQLYKNKDGKEGKHYFTRHFDNKKTKEIWVYGLDKKDIFKAKNIPQKTPKIRLIGGQDKDTYSIDNAKNISIHDFKSKKNHIKGKAKKHLTDQYHKNLYEFRKVKDQTLTVLPIVAYNPDDGFNLGTNFTLTNFGFNQQPFTNKHTIKAKYFTATKGFDVAHTSEFATYMNKWNVFVNTRFTSSNYSNNFFGFGNNTQNLDNSLGLNYNRVKTEIKQIQPGLVWNNLKGAMFKISTPFKIYEIEETTNRFINTQNIAFGSQNFVGLNTLLSYERHNSKTLSSLGFEFILDAGFDYNLSKKSLLPYLKPSIGIVHPLSLNHKWVLASKVRTHFNFNNYFQPYQAAFIGGNNGLRGFRNERFSGKNAFVQNTDIRYTLGKTKTPILPISYGLNFSYDYGRVWLDTESSNRWHYGYGGGFWISAPGVTKFNFNLFNTTEGTRFTFTVGVHW